MAHGTGENFPLISLITMQKMVASSYTVWAYVGGPKYFRGVGARRIW